MQLLGDVCKQTQLLPKQVPALSIPSHATEDQKVVRVQTVSKAVVPISEEMTPAVDKVVVSTKVTVEEAEPLSGPNMQLKRVHDDLQNS